MCRQLSCSSDCKCWQHHRCSARCAGPSSCKSAALTCCIAGRSGPGPVCTWLRREWCWWYRCVFPNTHNTHAHAQLYVHATLLLRVSTLSIPAACLLLHRNRITHWLTLQLPLNSQLLSMFIRLRCMDDKLSWLRGWSSARCSPQCHFAGSRVVLYESSRL